MPKAICQACKLEMVDGGECAMTHRSHNQKIAPRIRYWYNMRGNCHDCGVRPGAIHHVGCDMEVCPFCGGQAMFECE